MTDKRLESEIQHGKILKDLGPGKVWNWETQAGRVRLSRRVKMLSSHITPATKVLEVGCGTGLYTREIAKTNAKITATDISPDLLEIAYREVCLDNVVFKVENAYHLSFSNETFHAVLGSSILHHLELDQTLGEIFRVLKPGGTICFTEPNMLNPQIFIQKNIPVIKKYLGDSPQETAFLRWKLKNQLKKHGFQNIMIIPFDFLHPLTPGVFIPFIKSLGSCLEKVPLLSEIAGSLYIRAAKPNHTM